MPFELSDLPEAPRGSIRARLLASHLLIAALGVCLLAAALYLLHDLGARAEAMAEKLGPESESYLHVLNGVSRSVSDVFAYTVLQDETLRRAHNGYWVQDVEPAMARLASLAPAGDANHAALNDQIQRLDAVLQRAEDLAASPENIPASVIYMNDIRPQLDALKSGLLAARERALADGAPASGSPLGEIGYAWGAIAISEGALRDFLESGGEGDEMQHLYWTDEVASALESLAGSGALAEGTPDANLREVLAGYRAACGQAIEARKLPDWNRALHVFKEEVSPLAHEVIDTLQDQAFRRTSETLAVARDLHQLASRALAGLLALGTLLAVFGAWVAGRQSKRISGPLIELAQAARELADEKYSRNLKVERDDEIGYVVATFNAMRNTLRARSFEIAATQEALRASEERYRAMVEISPTPYVAVSEGFIVYINDAATALLGAPAEGVPENGPRTMASCLGNDADNAMRAYAAGLAAGAGPRTALEVSAELGGEPRCLEVRGARFQLFGNEAVLYSVHDITDRKNTERRLRRLSDLDALTEVPNRRALDDQIEHRWTEGCATGSPLSFILVDVDFFKRYNDNYGHQAGDACLRRVASILHASVRATGDVLARYGGEEFAFLLPDTPAEGAAEVARRALQAVRKAEIPHDYSDAAGHVTVSMGVYTIVPSVQIFMASLIEKADRALYEAKLRGRNQAVAASRDDETKGSDGSGGSQ